MLLLCADVTISFVALTKPIHNDITSTERVLHFLFRYNPVFKGFDTFSEHRAIEQKHGAVWWGKFGMGTSRKIITQVEKQIKEGVSTYVYLMSERHLRYRGQMIAIQGGGGRKTYEAPEPELVPEYYRREACSLWFKLRCTETLTQEQKEGLALYNHPFLEPTLNSMRSLIYVTPKVGFVVSAKERLSHNLQDDFIIEADHYDSDALFESDEGDYNFNKLWGED